MRLARLWIKICAPPERCYALARDLELRRRCDAEAHAIIAARAARGRFNQWEDATWRSANFAVWRSLQPEVFYEEPPISFSEQLPRGLPFSFFHNHSFSDEDGGTLMVHLFKYEFPDGYFPSREFIGMYTDHLLCRRSTTIKRIAEGDDWTSKFTDDDE